MAMAMEGVKFCTHPHPVKACERREPIICQMCFCLVQVSSSSSGYHCETCVETFHKECAESLPKIRHPYHPKHSLQLFQGTPQPPARCYNCKTRLVGLLYHCPQCEFYMHPACARMPPVLRVDEPKCHEHTVTLLPRRLTFTCDACASVDDWPPIYVCHPCDFMVHKECIYLPRVIRINRHQHRLSRSSSLPPSPQPLSCGVCRKAVDSNYGSYSCSKGCPYVAHLRCATRDDVCDGKELEGVPEEIDETEDIEPFKVIDRGVIHHFSHDHYLTLIQDCHVSDGSQHCDGCSLPIFSNPFYSCTQSDCRFLLHERCAKLLRKKWFIQHPHPLKLQVDKNRFKLDPDTGTYDCRICDRYYNGFGYKCCEEDCNFQIDVRCASISEPFIYHGHQHPLYSTSSSYTYAACSACGEDNQYDTLNCIECDFVLDLICATLPNRITYKYDEHPLVLCRDEDAKGTYWCEICEEEMDPQKKMFYTCDDCCVTVHIECILGKHPYLKPGESFIFWGEEFEVVANNTCVRPFCHSCKRRCPYPVVLKKNGKHVCCVKCLRASFDFLI